MINSYKRISAIFGISVFLAVIAGSAAAQNTAAPSGANTTAAEIPPGLDQHIDKVLKSFDVPGVAVSIVKDGKILLTKGYGTKRLGHEGEVDENTLFSIASNSKAFTGTALAMLVDDGKLNWNDRVVDHLPWFKLSDVFATQNLTIQDLLVHHSGLPAYANDMLLFPPANMSRKELLLKLKDVPLIYDFRSVYAYDNILYLAAGEVVEAVSGLEWEDFVSQRIFKPLGMNRSVSRFSTLIEKENVAYAHARRQGEIRVVDSFFVQNIGDPGNPAGGIASTAADMAKWAKMHLDSGRIDNHYKLFDAKSTKDLWKTVISIPISKEPEHLKPAQKHFYGYGLGFRTYDYRGHQIVGHGGLLTGFVSQLALVPQLDLGIVVMTNQLSTGAYWAIIHQILDYYMQAEPFDWIAGYKKGWDDSKKRQDSVDRTHKEPLGDKSLPRTVPQDQYIGVYKDDFVGRIHIKQDGQDLRLVIPGAPQNNGVLVHFHGDLYRLHYDNSFRGEGPYLQFLHNPDKTIREARFTAKNSRGGSPLERIVLKPDKDAIVDIKALEKKIKAETGKHPEARIAVSFINLQNGEEYHLNSDQKFHAASTMKTPVMLEAFKQAEQGKFDLDGEVEVYNKFKSIANRQTYSLAEKDDSELSLYNQIGSKTTWRNLIYLMMTESSNLATNILIDKLGAKNIMKTLRDLDASGIDVLRGVEDQAAYDRGMNNQVTARGLAAIFARLGRHELISKNASEEMIKILRDQAHRDIIPALLPRDVKTANKTGWITNTNHDSGLVILPDDRKYVLVLLSSNLDDKKAKASLSKISKMVYDYVSGKK